MRAARSVGSSVLRVKSGLSVEVEAKRGGGGAAALEAEDGLWRDDDKRGSWEEVETTSELRESPLMDAAAPRWPGRFMKSEAAACICASRLYSFVVALIVLNGIVITVIGS